MPQKGKQGKLHKRINLFKRKCQQKNGNWLEMSSNSVAWEIDHHIYKRDCVTGTSLVHISQVGIGHFMASLL
jgi:hypothetical protein